MVQQDEHRARALLMQSNVFLGFTASANGVLFFCDRQALTGRPPDCLFSWFRVVVCTCSPANATGAACGRQEAAVLPAIPRCALHLQQEVLCCRLPLRPHSNSQSHPVHLQQEEHPHNLQKVPASSSSRRLLRICSKTSTSGAACARHRPAAWPAWLPWRPMSSLPSR